MYQIKGSDLIGPKKWMFEPIKCQGHFAVAEIDFSDVVLYLYLHKWAVTCIWSSPYNILDLNLDSESPIHLKSVPCDVLQEFQTVISLILLKKESDMVKKLSLRLITIKCKCNFFLWYQIQKKPKYLLPVFCFIIIAIIESFVFEFLT